MKNEEKSQPVAEHIVQWVREVAGLGVDAQVEVKEEPHCPDPSCPLRRTAILWTDSAGKPRRTVVVKPLDYVRRADIERAWRLIARA